MSLKDYTPPFSRLSEHSIQDAKGRTLLYLSSGIVGEFIDVLNAHFTKKEEPAKEQAPTTNKAETDRVAVEFIKSGRKLTVQSFHDGTWVDWSCNGVVPSFHYDFPWRIKPSKRKVVVNVYQSPVGNLSAIVQPNNYVLPSQYKLIGTIEGEVEG